MDQLLKEQEQKLLVEQELHNYLNVQYYSSLYLGSQHQEVTLIYDTGSSYLWVPTDDCIDCAADTHNEVYHHEQSSTYKRTSSQPHRIAYGVGSVEGYLSTDLVCLSDVDAGLQSKNCLPNHHLLAVYLSNDLSNLEADGLLGLAPSDQGSGNKLFIEELYNAGVIGAKVFSMSLGQSALDQNSRVVLGGFRPELAKPGAPLTWNPLVDTAYWTVELSAFSAGGKELPISAKQAVLDTGSSFIVVPRSDFDQLIYIFSQKNAFNSEKRGCVLDKKLGILKCACNADTQIERDFPVFEVNLGGNLYELKPQHYAVKLQDQCYFKFTPGSVAESHQVWILGDAFLMNYVAIFDLEGKRVGLVEALHVEVYDYAEAAYYLALAVIFLLGAAALGKDSVKEWLGKSSAQSAPEPWFQQRQNAPDYELQYRAPTEPLETSILSGSAPEDGEMAFSEEETSPGMGDTEK